MSKQTQSNCPLLGYEEFVKSKTVPRCFYCGNFYVPDEKYCCDKFNVFKPQCMCLNKTTIRVVIDK